MKHSFSRLLTSAVLLASLTMIAPSTASAKGNSAIPPGNSAINQYLESIPTAKGGKPTNRIHSNHGSHSSATSPSGGGGGSGGPGSPGGPTTGGEALSGSTSRALARQGSAGSAAAAFARATAPASASRHTESVGPSGGSVSPTSQVLKSLTGSSSSGGLGPLLPAILVLILVGGALMALLRRRARSSSSS